MFYFCNMRFFSFIFSGGGWGWRGGMGAAFTIDYRSYSYMECAGAMSLISTAVMTRLSERHRIERSDFGATRQLSKFVVVRGNQSARLTEEQ